MASDNFRKTYLDKHTIIFQEEIKKAKTEEERNAQNRIDTENKITEIINKYMNEDTIKNIKEQLLKNLVKKITNVKLTINLEKVMIYGYRGGWCLSKVYGIVEYGGKLKELTPKVYAPTDKESSTCTWFNQDTEDYFKDYNKDTRMLKKYIEDNIEGSKVIITAIGTTLTYTISIV